MLILGSLRAWSAEGLCVMTQVQRLLAFLKPYSFRFLVSFILMALVGACEALTALLIKPVFDRVLAPGSDAGKIVLLQWPFGGRAIYLQSFFPAWIHNAWTIVAISIVSVTLIKGVAEFLATYFINFIGHSVVRDLRNLLYSRIIQQSMAFFTRTSTGV